MAEKKIKVRFLETCTVQDAEGFTFEEGKTYDLVEPSALRWIRRRKAEAVKASDREWAQEALAEGVPGVTTETAFFGTPETTTAPADSPARKRGV